MGEFALNPFTYTINLQQKDIEIIVIDSMIIDRDEIIVANGEIGNYFFWHNDFKRCLLEALEIVYLWERVKLKVNALICKILCI